MIGYQLLMALALPVLVAREALTGPAGALAERLGQPAPPRPGPGPRLWLHAASVGEVTSARWLVEALMAARPGLQVLVTCNSTTGRATAAGWGLPGLTAALAPFDSAGAAGRVLDLWQPQALLVVENELWPARLAAADNRGVPVLVVGARMSARSAARWARLAPGLMRRTLGRVTWLSAQDDGSLQRLRALGLAETAIGPVVALKSLGRVAAGPPPFAPPAPRDRTLLAASTHEGEEALVLAAFAQARDRFDHLILAPRHPRRGPEVAAEVAARGLTLAIRSQGQVPGANTAVHLADTLGEMDHWYAMAGACIIGGTFAPRGGHTPWEPARHGMALIHGPDVANFAAPFAALDRAGAALAVADGAGLARALAGLDTARMAELARRAADQLQPQAEGGAVVQAVLQVLKG